MTAGNQHVQVRHIHKDDASSYPGTLPAYLRDRAPDPITAIGDPNLLQLKALGLFSSVRCPGDLILRAYDLARALRDAGVPVIGGFHSPMERECLALLLRGTAPVIVCPARAIERMRIPHEWRDPIAAGRLLVLSPFVEGQRRASADLATRRNQCVAALAGAIVAIYAEPGGITARTIAEAIAWGQPVAMLDSPDNAELAASGARPLAVREVAPWWYDLGGDVSTG